MYRVVAEFYDLQDNQRHYLPGDAFPRKGFDATEKRLESLATDRNLCGHPLIAPVEEQPVKPTRKRVKKNDERNG